MSLEIWHPTLVQSLRKKIRARKIISRIKKSDSESVVQDEILHICDSLFFIYAWNRDANCSVLKKTNCITLKCTFDYSLVFGSFLALLKRNYLNKLSLH